MLGSKLDSETTHKCFQTFQWKQCSVCPETITFRNPEDFSKHLRTFHCNKEGGSFVCKYGYNGVCSSLPVEGVSDKDYEDHVSRHHIFQRDDHVHLLGNKAKSTKVGISGSQSTSQPTALGFHDLGTAVQHHGDHNLYLSTQNLPAVLNDPGRGKSKDLFTKTWGDSFVEVTEIPPCPYIPQVTGKHFESYLRKIARKQRKRHRKQSGSRVSSSDASVHKTKGSRTPDWREPEYENIPKIFLQAEFSLQDVSTFNTVFPGVLANEPAAVTSPKLVKSQPSCRLLQEKLAHYLDIVEIEIARQVSLRSKAFFHAMTSHDALMEQLSNAVSQVKMLRDRVHTVDDILVKGSFRVLQLRRRRQTNYTVYKKLKLIATVHQTQPAIQLLLSTSDFVGALDLISTTQEVLQQELSEIHSFRHLGSQLAEMSKIIDKMIHSDFIRYATSDLTRPLTDTDAILEEERLVAIILGMLRLKKHFFIGVYQQESINLIKAVLKQSVLEMNSTLVANDHEHTTLTLSDQLRPLNFDKWMKLVTTVLNRFKKILLRVKGVYTVMCDAVNIAGGKSNNPSPICKVHQNSENLETGLEELTISDDEYSKLSNSLKLMLNEICDFADDRSARIFSAKSKDGFFEKLSVNEFVILSKPVEDFVNDCETICQNRCTTLLLALQSQAHRFISHFHEEKKTKLGLILDSERWVQAENVPVKFQELVDHLCSSDNLSLLKDNCNDALRNGEKSQDVLIVKGENYKVIGTVLLLLNMVIEYCNCVEGLPYAAPEILTRLVELLKTFNSRSCQLVLGAGALQLVGLKTITTKNLALASRCLQLMVFFIPKLKMHFIKYLSQKQQNSIKQFDQALKDYSDHIQEISNKLVNIIVNMLEAQLTKWEVRPPVPSPCFRAICKHLSKLHEAIAGILPPDQVQKLFLRINTSFKGILRKHLAKLNVANDGGPQHGLVTSELVFYMQSLKSIDCVRNEDDLGMEDIWIAR
ncbi:hypothetical protein CHUAL_004290 [Chamberlinius hualienensis]